MSHIRLGFGYALTSEGVKGAQYKVQVLRCGSWQYGEDPESGFDLTESDLREIVSNFKAAEKGVDVPLMYGHDDASEAQCGWVKDLALEGKGADASVWAYFDLTDGHVRRKVDEGSIKYSSSELDLAYVNPERARTTGDTTPRKVFEGLALTNRPYIKGMAPVATVTLTERSEKPTTVPEPTKPNTENDSVSVRLAEQERETEALRTKLAERDRDIEAIRKDGLRRDNENRKRLNETIIRERCAALKLSPAVSNRALRLNTLLCLGGAHTVKLSEPVRVAKVRLAEGESPSDESVDTLDVMAEVMDLLQELPDNLSQDAAKANLEEAEDDTKESGGESEAIKAAEKRFAEDPKLNFRIVLGEELQKRGVVRLGAKKGDR
ncbi:hypothetical protein EON81_16140 [bacterium]|nr:MAG: hypothetical protein EON81_16140 [bacterium]